MSKLLSDDTRYVKLLLLLFKGGTYVSKKQTLRILDDDNTTIDIFLKTHRDQIFNAFKKRDINRKLWERLSPDSGQPKNVDDWDISALAYVLLNLFDKKLTASEIDNIIKLRNKRNELAHPRINSLSETKFLSEWSKLTTVLNKLSTRLTSNDQDYVEKLIDDVSAIQEFDKANSELKPFESTDDYVKDVLAEQLRSHEKRLDEYCRRISDLERKNEILQLELDEERRCISELERKDESYQSELDEHRRRISKLERTIESLQIEIIVRITASASTQTACDAAHHKLLKAGERCLTCGHIKQDSDEVDTTFNNIFTDMSKEGAHLKKVEEGSVLVTFSCSTWTSLKRAILYLTKTLYSQRLQELEKALSQSVGCSVKLNVNIDLESLHSLLDKAEHGTNKSVVLTMSCKGSKGVRSVCDNLVNGSSTNTVNNLSEALSRSVDQSIHLHASIDVDKLEQEISNLERRYEYHDEIRKANEVYEEPLEEQLKEIDKLNDGLTEKLLLEEVSLPEQPDSLKKEAVIQERLKKSYERAFSTVCISPLDNEDDRVDMLSFYTRPVIKHETYQLEGNYGISSYEQIFCEQIAIAVVGNILVTGEAGMGKTTFVQFMSLLWSKAIAGDIVSNEDIQKVVSFMTIFDFVFYIPLTETYREDVVSMIVDKYFNNSSMNEFEKTIGEIEKILQTKQCLVILDGLDEWRPDKRANRNLSFPQKVTSDTCTYLTTCRPYILDTVRLSEMDIGRHVQITGYDHEKYIRKVIDYMNKLHHTNKKFDDFLHQIKYSEMENQLHIPLLTTQLIAVWFEHEINKMSKASIHNSTLEMLFERAVRNQITFPSMSFTHAQIPESISKFTYLQKYVSTLEKVCLLSFLLLFDPHDKSPMLVFTKTQLMSEPYKIAPEEIDFLCQLGILYTKEVNSSIGEQEHILSFLHMRYLEYLAALFVELFDKTGLFPEVVKKLHIDDVVKYRNFLILLSGISPQMIQLFFVIIYTVRKDELDFMRRKIFTSPFSYSEYRPLGSMQEIIFLCLKEMHVSEDSQRFIKLENLICDEHALKDPNNLRVLKQKLVLNRNNVKWLITDVYLDEFSAIKGLEYLFIGQLFTKSTFSVKETYNDMFKGVMLMNQSTLHTVGIRGKLSTELPLRSLRYLTSIGLYQVLLKHEILEDLMSYISSNILLQNINIQEVRCTEHVACKMTLNLSYHSKLITLVLQSIDILCSGINASSLTSLLLGFLPPRFDSSMLLELASSLEITLFEYLSLHSKFECEPWVNVIGSIGNLAYIEHLTLWNMTIPDSVSFQLHPHIAHDKPINVLLILIRMSAKCFHDFIDSIIKTQIMVKVDMVSCTVNDTSNLKLDVEQYIRTIPCLRITRSIYRLLQFETKE